MFLFSFYLLIVRLPDCILFFPLGLLDGFVANLSNTVRSLSPQKSSYLIRVLGLLKTKGCIFKMQVGTQDAHVSDTACY